MPKAPENPGKFQFKLPKDIRVFEQIAYPPAAATAILWITGLLDPHAIAEYIFAVQDLLLILTQR